MPEQYSLKIPCEIIKTDTLACDGEAHFCVTVLADDMADAATQIANAFKQIPTVVDATWLP